MPAPVPDADPQPARAAPVPLVVLCGWALPGAGYWLAGERWRACVVGPTVLALFALGLLIGGVRVVDVPGYDLGGRKALLGNDKWELTAQPVPTVMGKPWFVAQALAGPAAFGAGRWSIHVARGGWDKSHAKIYDVGTIYTAVAGLLNLYATLDAAGRANRAHVDLAQTRRRR